MNNDIPAAKIKMMKGSLRCFIFGLLGLLPVIGPPFAIAALWASGRARAKEKLFLECRAPLPDLGRGLRGMGAVVWSFVDIFLIYHAFNNYAAS